MFKLSENIGADYLNDGNVLVDFNTGKFFGVNDMSALIINSIVNQKNKDEILDIIVKKYDVDIQIAENDLKEHIHELIALCILVEI